MDEHPTTPAETTPDSPVADSTAPDSPASDSTAPAAAWLDTVRLSSAEVFRHRVVVVIVLRIGGMLCLALSLAPVLSWLFEGIRDGDLFMFSYYLYRLTTAVVLLALGCAGLLLSPRVAAWLVPADAKPLCPGCGFDLAGLSDPRCPECGLVITSSRGVRPVLVQYQSWVRGTTLVLRLVAVVWVVWRLGVALDMLLWTTASGLSYALLYPLMGWSEFMRTLLLTGLVFVPGLLLWRLSVPLARRCVVTGIGSTDHFSSPPS
ncbi:MAG: hypothetical protein HND58_02260 [Planctomycetota bacterium]|nr:MAG: hypothetical protein HND58_02260 [Planctomycetota bacterium]